MPSSNLLKGSLSFAATNAPGVQSVVFQFNPETMTRLQLYSEQDNAITESIRFELVFNAVEGLEQAVPDVVENGVYPALAALEELLLNQTRQQRAGWPAWLFPPRNVGFLALIYGERIIPVKIQRLNMKELLHNSQLKPVYAKADIALRVLTEPELRGNVAGLAALAAYKNYRRRKAQFS
ncbi:MAG: hypothetical protein WBN96_11800 [Gammaproteobacteria bacterium]